MRIEYFLFFFFIIFCFWLIPKLSFIKKADLTIVEIRTLLTVKMLSGIACAFYFQNISTNFDYLAYNTEGKIQHQLLLTNPSAFFGDISNDFHNYGLGKLFGTDQSFWGYLRFNLLYKFIAILDLVTQGNFYFNTIVFCSLVFFGHVAFYRIYSEIYEGHKLALVIATFCLPSLLLYTSCIHKDGIIFLSLGIASYIFFRILSDFNLIKFKYIGYLLLSLAAIFLFRNYVIVAIVPATITAILSKVLPYKKRFVFLITYSIFCLVFFLTGIGTASFNLPAAVVQRKADFDALPAGNTDLPMNELYPTFQSFVLNFPQAVNHYLFRPYLWEFPQPAVLLTAIELFVYQVMILAFIFFRKKQSGAVNNFNIFGLAFVFNMMLIIGYTIPNVGAIVRYRSIFWLFLLCPILCNTNWEKLFSFRKSSQQAS